MCINSNLCSAMGVPRQSLGSIFIVLVSSWSRDLHAWSHHYISRRANRTQTRAGTAPPGPPNLCIKRGLCRHAVSVCVSVCLSVTFVHSVKTSIHILRLFSPSGRSIILVFPYETGRQYSDGNPPPLTGASNARGYKKSRFSTNIWLYLRIDAR